MENESRILQGINQFPTEMNGGSRTDQNKDSVLNEQKPLVFSELTELNL